VQIPGSSRDRLARALNAAYADGLLSEQTLAYRLDLLFRSRLVDPVGLVGDLTGRTARRVWRSAVVDALEAAGHRLRTVVGLADRVEPMLLALDWSGAQEQFLLGRHPACDVVLGDLSVSRRHARLRYQDGGWTLHDLDSTNGTKVNGLRVGRCALRPGDRLALGDERLVVD
jgi:FHA domain